MKQIMSFKGFLIELVMNEIKIYTTRLETPYRLKLNVGDIIYIYTGIRTKSAKKWGEAIIIGRWRYNQQYLVKQYRKGLSPIVDIGALNLVDFMKKEGFSERKEYLDYFTQKEYVDQDLITYKFKLKKDDVFMDLTQFTGEMITIV